MAKYKLQQSGVKDTETNAVIPCDPANRHWQEYQDWLAEGNTPDPEYTQEELDAQAVLQEITELQQNLKTTLHWLFRMILKVWETGVAKGIWTNADIADSDLKQKASDWKTKLDRLKSLGQ